MPGGRGEAGEERRGILLVLGAALLWSTGGVAIKAVAAGPLKVACYRSAIAAVVLLARFRPRGWRRTPAFVIAVVSYAGCLTTFVVATKWTSAANAIFLQYSGVVWILLLSPAVLGEPLRARDAGAIAVALAGMGLFFVGDLALRGQSGNLVALASGFFFAALILALRRERDAGAEAAAAYGNVLTAVALLPFVAADPGVTVRSAALLLFLGVVQLAGGYMLFVRGLRHVPATLASLAGMLEPIANPVWVFLLLGEVPRLMSIVGGLVVLGAIAWRTLAADQAPVPVVAPD